MPEFTFHLLPNAHLDPVWLWDWREGLNEVISTTHAVLDLMDEFPDLTFMRGESVLYRHLEEHDPQTFLRMKAMIDNGRWEVVGGTFIQADNNLPATATLQRNFTLGKAYFADRFGKSPRVAWSPDSFGHSAGLPEILRAAGMDAFSFSRPFDAQLPLTKPAFWWEGSSGARVLAYRVPVGGYGCERDEITQKLDLTLTHARQTGLQHVGVYIGLGNHGGGPTRRQILDVQAWAKAHPEINVVFSGLHRLLDSLRAEAESHGEGFLPVLRGELNFCMRGCYASMANFKTLYRKAEVELLRAERLDGAIAAALQRSPADFTSAWEALLFNSFHDILPGTSIERAYDDQRDWLGVARHESRRAELAALNALTARIDTRVPPPPPDHPGPAVLAVFNPHPHEYCGTVELEAALDHRPIAAYKDRVDELPVEVRGPDREPLAYQMIATEHSCFQEYAWRKRVLIPVKLPPLGWSIFEMQWLENARRPQSPSLVRAETNSITNGIYQISADTNHSGVNIHRHGKPVFDHPGLHCVTVEDPWGSWGNMEEEAHAMNLSDVRHAWKITQVETLESGPERAVLWVRLEGGSSRLDLSLALCRDRNAVDVSARLFWSERSARLKLVMPAMVTQAEFEVPGGTILRGSTGEVPGGRWVRTPDGKFGFASDALYGFDITGGALRATLVRSTRYANNSETGRGEELWRPATDLGEHRFNFILAPGDTHLPRLAAELEMPPVVVTASTHPGDLPRRGSLLPGIHNG